VRRPSAAPCTPQRGGSYGVCVNSNPTLDSHILEAWEEYQAAGVLAATACNPRRGGLITWCACRYLKIIQDSEMAGGLHFRFLRGSLEATNKKGAETYV